MDVLDRKRFGCIPTSCAAMRILFLLPLAMLLAGCSEQAPGFVCPDAPPKAHLDAITPSCWRINGNTDHILLWVHNPGSTNLTGSWSLQIQDGKPLPAGWSVSFSKPGVALAPNGTKQGGEYPDWDWTLVTIQISSGARSDLYRATARVGNLSAELQIHVAPERGTVSGPGSSVAADYRGTFQSTGDEFDSGNFPTELGSGRTVVGFDYGLMGLAIGEKASLHVPPALAYGYDNPPGSGFEQFNGQWLVFDVELTSIR